MTQQQIEKIKKEFEANMLDGDDINDCGGAMLSAKEVWLYFRPVISKVYLRAREEEDRKHRHELAVS